MPEYSDNYYTQTASSTARYPSLARAEEADVCVVGAGLAGLTAALTLARAGKRVILLDAERIAWGASGRNGGVVSPGYATSFDAIAKRAGDEAAGQLHRLSIEGVEIVRNNIGRLDIQGTDPINGVLRVGRFDNSDEVRKYIAWVERTFDYPLQFHTKDEIRALLASRKYFNAIYNPGAFHFHPLNYAIGLAQEITRLGGLIFEDSRALGIEHRATVKQVTTRAGSVRAKDVLIACGGYTDRLVPALARSYIPILTYMVVSRPAQTLLATAIRTRASIGDSRRSSDYYRLVDGGRRLLWGGMITTRQAEPAQLGALLKQRIVDTYPQLAELEIERAWSGRMAYARHLMPQIGTLGGGLWYCTSFGGHGMNTTAIGGTVIAEAMLGASARYKLFSPFGLTWTGGPLGAAAVQLTYWRYQLNDFLQERKSQVHD
ncbi:oxidoreductase [Pandoraea thiooxydans]|uniref:Oxidoreductase n=1 Tax=Pandoraea thiooxydans TaxID=445709 RepID=A0A0G3EPK8_9BURK|nr:FAD-binding oxidoreductase [Pandoraea thiooxydans]AKJ68998.1 oxidoreductase [Pandoraea thiooxydans]